MNTGIFEILQLGGHIMWLILLASVIGFAVFVERLIYYHRCSIDVGEFLKGVTSLVRAKKYDEAVDRCDEAYGPAVRVVQAALVKRRLPKSDLKEFVQEIAQLQMPRLESHLGLLATIAYISPLLGLLGTVIGMIKAFMEMNTAMGSAPISDLAGGIWEALITTAGGLAVAIVAYSAFNYLSTRLNRIVSDIERAGIEIVQVLNDPTPLEPGRIPPADEDSGPLPPAGKSKDGNKEDGNKDGGAGKS